MISVSFADAQKLARGIRLVYPDKEISVQLEFFDESRGIAHFSTHIEESPKISDFSIYIGNDSNVFENLRLGVQRSLNRIYCYGEF